MFKRPVYFLFCLISGTAGFLFSSCVTPGASVTVLPVEFSVQGGTLALGSSVELTTATENATIYYSAVKPVYPSNYSIGAKGKEGASKVTYTFSKAGRFTLYAVAVDGAGNASVSRNQSYIITEDEPVENENTALFLGNPSNATADVSNTENYLLEKSTYAVSYNNSTLNPNWVAWHLVSEDTTNVSGRSENFKADETLPDSFTKVQSTSYSGSGFDRGHQCPSADRTATSDSNDETFYMTNMTPQCNQMNGGTWACVENYERSLISGGDYEAYIYAGPYGKGGTSRYGAYKETIGSLNITVPAYSWKIIIALPKGTNDINRITADTRVIAVMMPNSPSCLNKLWSEYRVSVDYIEEKTGFDFFSEVPDDIEAAIEAKVDTVELSMDEQYSVYYSMVPAVYVNGTEVEGNSVTVSAGTKVTLVTYPSSASCYYSASEITSSNYKTATRSKTFTVDETVTLYIASVFVSTSSVSISENRCVTFTVE